MTGESVAIYELHRFQSTLDPIEHPEFELALIERGRGRRRLGDEVVDFDEGDMCLLGSGTPHVWQMAPSRDAGAIIVRLPPLTIARWSLVPEWRRVLRLLDGAVGGLAVKGRTRQHVAGLLQEAVHTPVGSWRRPTTVLAALGALCDSDDCTPLGGGGRRQVGVCDRLATVCAYVDEHQSDVIVQSKVARQVGLQPGPFSRWFRHATGQRFAAFVNETRITRACRALVTSTDRVVDIAATVGFDSLSNFNRQFQRLMGVSPTEHRRSGSIRD